MPRGRRVRDGAAERLHGLQQLQSQLDGVQEALLTIGVRTQKLVGVEASRRLTRDEERQAGELRREQARLRLELRRLREEFVALQADQ